MSRISNLLAQILSAVHGKEVRQYIHDAIEQCYTDVNNAKTLADASVEAANTAAANAQTKANAADTAASGANAAILAANTAATAANQATTDILKAFDDLGLKCVDGRICAKVERK